MHRLRTATWAALPLLLPLLAAGPASASSSSPTLPLRSVRSVHPGDTLTAIAKDGQAAYGDIVHSSVFIAAGKLRMMDPLLTTTVTIACDARPGTYPVVLYGANAEGPAGHPAPWARVQVEPADEDARRACRDKVKNMPPPDREERWAANDTWPQSEWDVRTFRAGSRITITDNDDEGKDGYITLTSRAFTDRPTLRGAKAVLTATTTLKCDATPGLYVVYRHDVGQDGPDRAWARLRVSPAPRAGACSTQAAPPTSRSSRTALVAWSVGGVLLASAVGAALLLRARSRRRLNSA
ncbi:hypothetical protein [Streptomyces sp. HUAS TT20]|uniref:hypothetical protein n=1 Tax=Streptomyces sp. HUAS TT20 TaxID=3447509 RepID=UPI0021D95659|nr:hypothetical protein [Streptomyces sp. HUAS 15-9]UXY33141.1 hypothetical protein N8I87_43335 [Streptomyces sp. HUAS 15-9]